VSETASITVRVPLTIRRRPGRKMVVTPVPDGSEAAVTSRSDPALVKALARAHRWRRMLDEGRYASISQMAGAERIDRGYLGRILQLTLLAPDIVEAILGGRQAAKEGPPGLLEPFPTDWARQKSVLFSGAPPHMPAWRDSRGRPGGRPAPRPRR
jgi:hypothetical protein